MLITVSSSRRGRTDRFSHRIYELSHIPFTPEAEKAILSYIESNQKKMERKNVERAQLCHNFDLYKMDAEYVSQLFQSYRNRHGYVV